MTDTELANMALAHVGSKSIDNIADNNDPASYCRAFIAIARQQFIKQSKLSKTTIEQALALADSESSVYYDYVYVLPANCLSPIEIWNGETNGVNIAPPILYEIGSHSNLTSSVVKTGHVSAMLKYSVDITNLNVYNVDDILAMSYALAALITMPLKIDDRRTQIIESKYLAALSIAMANDKNGQKVDVMNNAQFNSIRGSRR